MWYNRKFFCVNDLSQKKRSFFGGCLCVAHPLSLSLSLLSPSPLSLLGSISPSSFYLSLFHTFLLPHSFTLCLLPSSPHPLTLFTMYTPNYMPTVGKTAECHNLQHPSKSSHWLWIMSFFLISVIVDALYRPCQLCHDIAVVYQYGCK